MTPSPFTHPSALDGSFPWVAPGEAQVHGIGQKLTGANRRVDAIN
jgi:hypothetical protein